MKTKSGMDSKEVQRLELARVAVLGTGCVGRYTAETLLKNGVGTVDLIDISRTHGRIESRKGGGLHYDYIVDTSDTEIDKSDLIRMACEDEIPVIICAGTGNRINPAALEVTDGFGMPEGLDTEKVRRELCEGGIRKFKIVYSREEPADSGADSKTDPSASACSHCTCPPDRARRCTKRRRSSDCNAYVTAMAGMLLASEVIFDLVDEIAVCGKDHIN